MQRIRSQDVNGLIKGFEDRDVLVVGDSILDSYYYGEAVGLALETPTMLAHEEKVERVWGGASNVVKNLLALGAKVTFVTLLGSDEEARYFTGFSHPRFTLFPVSEPGRRTVVKRRFYVRRSGVDHKYFEQHRIDDGFIGDSCAKKVLDYVDGVGDKFDTVLLVDYRLGLFSPKLIAGIKSIARERKLFTIASSQVFRSVANHLEYSGVDVICMNRKEFREVFPRTDLSGVSEEDIRDASLKLGSGICLTEGREGSRMFWEGYLHTQPAIEVEELDPCGAGDSFLAAFALTIASGDPGAALSVGNTWAGLAVNEMGTSVPKLEDLRNVLSGG